jgi:hypothetical protein
MVPLGRAGAEAVIPDALGEGPLSLPGEGNRFLIQQVQVTSKHDAQEKMPQLVCVWPVVQ